MKKFNVLSLFANVGVAETYLKDIGVNVLVANEINESRAAFYKHLYPETHMIIGDITQKNIKNLIIEKSIENEIDIVMATPPCQGMSIAGKMDEYDERNQLISYAIDIIKELKPKYVFLENVPQLLTTKIKVDQNIMLIPEYLKLNLGNDYTFAQQNIVSAMDYDVPQMRKRNIFLLSRKDQKYVWQIPSPHKQITLRDVLYNLPSVFPLLKEGYEETIKLCPDFEKLKNEALKLSPLHRPPKHAKKHVIAMMHTPSGKTAFDNPVHYPKKDNGEKVNGHYNTYRRHSWDKPSRTITQNNGVISSLCCVHPGKEYHFNNETLYSDPRCFTIYELLLVSSLPTTWNIPPWADDTFVRHVIGEGIPPMLVKNIFNELVNNYL